MVIVCVFIEFVYLQKVQVHLIVLYFLKRPLSYDSSLVHYNQSVCMVYEIYGVGHQNSSLILKLCHNNVLNNFLADMSVECRDWVIE